MSDNNAVSKPSSPMGNLNIFHVGGELLVIVVMFIYFQMKMSSYTNRLEDLKLTTTEQYDDIESLREEIMKLRSELQEQKDTLSEMQARLQPRSQPVPKVRERAVRQEMYEDDDSIHAYRTPSSDETITRIQPPPPPPPPARDEPPLSKPVVEEAQPQPPPQPQPQPQPPSPKKEERVMDLDELLKDELSGLD